MSYPIIMYCNKLNNQCFHHNSVWPASVSWFIINHVLIVVILLCNKKLASANEQSCTSHKGLLNSLAILQV